MKTNLLAQNDNLVIENLKADVGKSVMDLSHSVTFPVGVDGALYPICCVETVPSDSFEINVECLLRQLTPLKVPLMTNFRLNTAFYYCDNRLAWKKWDRFMTGGRSGNEVYDIPRCANVHNFYDSKDRFDLADTTTDNTTRSKKVNYKTTLHTYFGICMNHKNVSRENLVNDYSSELPVAFPFFDYQLIKRDFYTDPDRLPQNPDSNIGNFLDFDDLNSDWAYSNIFPVDDDEIRLIDGPQVKSGYNTDDDFQHVSEIKGFILDKIRYHDVRPDYFTTSKKAPMRGTAPSLSAVTANLKLPSGTSISLNTVSTNDTKQDIIIFDDTDPGFPTGNNSTPLYSYKSTQTGNNMIAEAKVGDVSYSPLQSQKFNGTEISGKTTTDLSVTGSVTTDFTAADIRLLSQLTVWQELNMMHEPYYNDFLNAHFDGVRVGESPVEKPQYIGGTSQLISINEILQTSQSTESSPLGNQGATAMSLANNFVGRYYCNNYGYIIGIAYIIPELLYKPAMPRHFSRRAKEDYYSPEFANLSMQATLNKEIYFSNDNDWNNAPWGYTGAFDEMRSIPNRIAGDLLNSSYTDLQKWVLVREMANDNLPAMESTWLSLKGNVDETAWSVNEGFPKFMLQVANYIKAVRPMPKVAIPKAL